MKILLLGPDGQVGWELRRALATFGELIPLGRRHEAGEYAGDLTDLDGLTKTVRAVQPQVIVNAAAYTAVDNAESEVNMARAINATAPGVLAREARKLGAWLVHYSTDYVFDGSGNRPWKETDEPAPLNVYGVTKLEGELAIRDSGCRHLILRTSWVYAVRGHNFVRTVLRLAQKQRHMRMIDDQVGAPTSAELIADVTAHVLRSLSGDLLSAGTYHLTAAGETSWYEYARFIVEQAHSLSCLLQTSNDAIEPIATAAFTQAAQRPLNSRLDCNELSRAFHLHLPHWSIGVKRTLAEMSSQTFVGVSS
jgi:dTDP-4-dehydrorhamnose reductase